MPEIKKDCFGFSLREGKCVVLTETFCRKEECSFYKTRLEYIKGLKKYPWSKKYLQQEKDQ